MLTSAEYDRLWKEIIPIGFQSNLPVSGDNYSAFCDRENMLQDYLDIFRGVNSRGVPSLRPFPSQNNPSPHPFFNQNRTSIKRQESSNGSYRIKYILIGEAPPNNGINYFYDTTAITGQSYLFEIFNAEYGGKGPGFVLTSPLTSALKIDALIDLANRGVLLLDLFPFATDYTLRGITRNNLVIIGITSSFWCSNVNPYNLIDRILNLYNTNNKIFVQDLEVQIGFIAPPTISHFIAANINSGLLPIPAGSTIHIGHNLFGVPAIRYSGNNFFYIWTIGTILNGIFPKPANLNLCPIFTLIKKWATNIRYLRLLFIGIVK